MALPDVWGPWPCQPAKLRLLGEYKKDRLALSMYLGTLLDVAVSEVPPTVERTCSNASCRGRVRRAGRGTDLLKLPVPVSPGAGSNFL
ncbi:hypothetical protein [Micromonospora echinospora]|uniref:hypothetical protein n=1 Tax=Micromonospora echinospora TaxID=1877 RepID=UPI0012FE5C2A|nr:hypothetical protein [Micromonospora echinospora]